VRELLLPFADWLPTTLDPEPLAVWLPIAVPAPDSVTELPRRGPQRR
jgi:hypothetical protein